MAIALDERGHQNCEKLPLLTMNPPTPYLERSPFAMVKHVQTSSVIMTNQNRCATEPHKTT